MQGIEIIVFFSFSTVFFSAVGFMLAHNVLGIAEGGEFMAESLNSAPRRAKTNFYELNLKIKNE